MRPRSVTDPTPRLGSRLVSRLAIPALVVVAVIVLAACGSSSDSGSDTTTTTKAASSSSKPAGTVVVETADVSSLGTILVDADGKTLYTLTDGDDEAVACTGACLTAWPPLLLPAGETTATGAAGVEDLATTPAGADLQVTHDGLPLYTFAGDPAAGDANGEGLASFGGTWHVVTVGGATSASSSSTTTTSSSGY